MNKKSWAALILLAGVFTASIFAWHSSIRYAAVELSIITEFSDEIEEDSSVEQDGESETETLEAGTYVFYKTVIVSDRGEKDHANDDSDRVTISYLKLGESETEDLIVIDRGPEVSGGLTASIYNQEILLNRYAEDQSAVLSLDGEINLVDGPSYPLVSKDGRYSAEIEFERIARSAIVSVDVTDEQTSDTVTYIFDPEDYGLSIGYMYPVAISDSGIMYLRQYFDGGGSFINGFWSVDLATQELVTLTSLEELEILGHRDNYLNVEEGKLIVATAEFEPSENGPSYDAFPPSSIYIIDIATDTATLILESNSFAYQYPRLSHDATSFSYQLNDNADVWIAEIGEDIRNTNLVLSGSLVDWIGDYIVVNRDNELVVLNVETNELVSLSRTIGSYSDPDYQRADYIGTITVE